MTACLLQYLVAGTLELNYIATDVQKETRETRQLAPVVIVRTAHQKQWSCEAAKGNYGPADLASCGFTTLKQGL
jgi:hypothetical protein